MSDNDLIRRSDAMRIMSDGDDIVGPDYPEWFINRYATINAIPAAQPTVSPDVAALEKILSERGAVFDAMVDAAEDAAGKGVSFNVVIGRALRAALARVKGETK